MSSALGSAVHSRFYLGANREPRKSHVANNLVNLDALIHRQEYDAAVQSPPGKPPETIGIRSPEQGDYFYLALRKPEFQRETAAWSPTKIADFVETFLNEELIPAVIMWRSPTVNFVIDGAHRLSALMAWIHDDYGNGHLSGEFFEQRFLPEQERAAEHTRDLVNKRIGPYAAYKRALEHPEGVKPDILARAQRLSVCTLSLQWVPGDASKAEEAFKKINQRAVPIDPTESRIIDSRRKPNGISARAIIHSGTGYKWWKDFPQEIQTEIEQIAKSINTRLFKPVLDPPPIKTLDLPFAGRGYSSHTLPLLFSFVNMVNGIQGDKAEKELSEDGVGEVTHDFLTRTLRIANYLSSTEPSSLGLHPAIYCYSTNGRFQPTGLLGIVSFVCWLEEHDSFRAFTQIRAEFEEFLWRHKNFTNQIATTIGSGTKGYSRLTELYQIVFANMVGEIRDDSEILKAITAHPDLGFLSTDERVLRRFGKRFSTDTKSEVSLRDLMATALTCPECKARLQRNAMVLDHRLGKQSGGIGDPANGKYVHPYCNSIKN